MICATVQFIIDGVTDDFPFCHKGEVRCTSPFLVFVLGCIFIPTEEFISCTFGNKILYIRVIINLLSFGRNSTACRIIGYSIFVSRPSCSIGSITITAGRNSNIDGRLGEIRSNPACKSIACASRIDKSECIIFGIVLCYIFAGNLAAVKVILYGIILCTPNGIEFDFKCSFHLIVIGFKLPFNKTVTVSAGRLETCKISRRVEGIFNSFGNIFGCGCKRCYI